MDALSILRSKWMLITAYALFFVSLVLPTISVDLGSNGGPVQSGYRVFLGGPVAAFGIILEPGGDMGNRYLGIYLVLAWLANLVLLLPLINVIPPLFRRVFGTFAALLTWSLLCWHALDPGALIQQIGSGYYFWAIAITMVALFLWVDTIPARSG